MKISLDWLKDYVKVGGSTDQLAHKLTMAGLEVEKITTVGNDKVFELEITPNRPDCLNVVGIAREVGAILNKTLKLPDIKKVNFKKKNVKITIEDKKDCSRYIGTIIRDVKVAPSPVWLRKKIEAIGIRSINNIVDITNFCLMETGQPLHAFNLDKLAGERIIVRRAKKNEVIVTIDEDEQKLDSSALVIADAKKAVAIAGIMGGKETEVDGNTKNILLESAYFDPALIRRTSRKIGLSSDSSYRFERGVDMDTVERGASRAINLIQKEAGGKITGTRDLYPGKSTLKRPAIHISQEDVERMLGAPISLAKSKAILEKLDFKVSLGKTKRLKAAAPVFRKDIGIKEDVVEEISRIIGYDNLPSSISQIQVSNIKANEQRAFKDNIREVLTAQGLSEIITYTMTNQSSLNKTNMGSAQSVKIINPLTQDQEMMRPSLLPGILSVVVSNMNRGQKNLRMFEIGKTYSQKGEKEFITILMMGPRSFDWRNTDKSMVNFYDIKGVVEALCASNGIGKLSFERQDGGVFQNDQNVCVKTRGKLLGSLGCLDGKILKNWKIKETDVYFAEIELQKLYENKVARRSFSRVSGFPSIVRDVSISVKNAVTFQQIQDVILKQDCEFLSSIKFVEEYFGDKSYADRRAMIFSVTYQSLWRTLTDDEVNKTHETICKALMDELDAIHR